eukprot:6170171-Amphidinium_carterae.1
MIGLPIDHSAKTWASQRQRSSQACGGMGSRLMIDLMVTPGANPISLAVLKFKLLLRKSGH